MDLLIFNHYAAPPDSATGTRHYDIARELVRRGHRVTIVAASYSHLSPRQRVEPSEKLKTANVGGVDFVWVRTPAYFGNRAGRLLNIGAYCWRALWFGLRAPAHDVVVGSSVHPFAGLVAWVVAAAKRRPFVFEVRDLWPQTLVDIGTVSPFNPLVMMLRFLEHFLYRAARRIITLLPESTAYLVSAGASPSRIAYIPNGVDFVAFDANRRQEVIVELPKNSFNVIYAGSLGLANAMEPLVHAARILQERHADFLRFVIIGEGPEKERLVRLCQESKVSNVSFLPPVPKSVIPAVLDRADALCLLLKDSPLYRYGISLNKLFDYLAAGKPVLFSGSSSNNPVSECGAGICVAAGDAEQIAVAALELSRMPESVRLAMGRAGRAYAGTHHDVRILADRFIDVMNAAASAG